MTFDIFILICLIGVAVWNNKENRKYYEYKMQELRDTIDYLKSKNKCKSANNK